MGNKKIESKGLDTDKSDDLSVAVIPQAARAQALVVSTPAELNEAVELLSKINHFGDGIKKEKEKLTKPINEALKEIRARYKPAEDAIETAVASLKASMASYQKQVMAKQAEEEAKIAARVGAGRGKITVETAAKRMDAIETADKSVKADSGAVTFSTVRMFEVMDLALVPPEYHLANEALIRADMKLGKELPGVRYYDEQRVINRR